MNLPGFTAETSIYKVSNHYGVTATLQVNNPSSTVHPQLRRATGPFGPIGLPGQGCEAACWHICKSFGGGINCEDNCRNSCSESSLMTRF